MGLFKKKQKIRAKDYVRLLTELGIDFFSYSHSSFEAVELTIDQEVAGFVKSSQGRLNDECLFEFILLSDTESGNRSAVLSKENSNEKEFRDLINRLANILGEDCLFRGDFESYDLSKIRGEEDECLPDDNIREWDTLYTNDVNYNIGVSYSIDDHTIWMVIAPGASAYLAEHQNKVPVDGWDE